jgi:hypothetical protein
MATIQGRGATWARKAIGAGLAAAAMALAAPADIAVADPTYGPSGVTDPAINDYVNKINALAQQYAADGPSGSGQMSQQQFADQITAVNNQLREAIRASVPVPGQ